MDRKTTITIAIGLGVWILGIWMNTGEYGEGSFLNDPLILVGLLFILLTISGYIWAVYGKAVSQRIITPIGSCSARSFDFIFETKAVYEGGVEIYPAYVCLARWSYRIPKVDIAPPGGKHRGYFVIPKKLFVRFGKDAIINVANLKMYVGSPNDNPDGLTHYDLPKKIRVELYNHLSRKWSGWSFNYPVFYGEEQYMKIDDIVVEPSNYAKRLELANNDIARLEQKIYDMREEETYNNRKHFLMGKKSAITDVDSDQDRFDYGKGTE